MGMYTGLRFKGIVKPEYRNMIVEIMKEYTDEGWEKFVGEFPFLTEFASLSRCNMIPWGSLCYMPDSWEDDSIQTEGFKRHFDPETGYWSFQCSLKNYSGEIACFLNEVVPVIIEESQHIEYLYEEWYESILAELKDGAVVRTGHLQYEYAPDSFHWAQIIE